MTRTLKDSSLLREAARVGSDWIEAGDDGIEEFVEIKYLCFGGIS